MFVCTMEEAECPMSVYILEFDIRVLSCLLKLASIKRSRFFNAFYSRMFICLAVRSEVMPLNCLVVDSFTLSP